MSNPGSAPPPVPSLTGNPGLDSIVRSVIIAGSAALTTWIVAWLALHKITDPNLILMIGGAVLFAMTTAFGAFWGWFKGTQVGHMLLAVQVQSVSAGRASTGVSAPDAQVTAAEAASIVKTYGPPLAAPVASAVAVSEAIRAAVKP